MKKKIKISILGMGYVGLPLAVESGKYFPTIGFDIDACKIKNLKKNIDLNNELSKSDIKSSKFLNFSSKLQDISKSNFYIVCVPTPINKNKKPDLRLLKNAGLLLSKIIKRGDFVVFESTVYPGVTEKICKEIISKKSGLKYLVSDSRNGFHGGYSPERLNPGEKNRKLYQITKIVSGSNNYSKKIISQVYSKIQKNNIFVTSSIQIAEAAKVIENVQRDVNIALVNEFSKIFDSSNIDIFEVLKAASTKWNFHRYFPGLVGGHCIGVDPYYLAYFSKLKKVNPRMIISGRSINDTMYKYVVNKIIKKSKVANLNISKANLLIMGYTFKKNCSDTRNTQVERIFNGLREKFKTIDIFDPFVSINNEALKRKNNFIKRLSSKKYDIVIIAVDHDFFYKLGIQKIKNLLKNKNGLIFDINNLFESKSFIHI